jgi:chromosome partitioning protein
MNGKRKAPTNGRPYIVALGGGKGGTGKTCIAAHLAVEGLNRGRKVLVVDADKQRSLSTWSQVALEREVALRPQLVQMYANMRHDLERVATGFDLVVIDCPGVAMDKDETARVVAAAYFVADYIIMPVAPGPTDVWSLHDSAEAIANVQSVRPGLGAGILLNKLGKSAASRTLREAVNGLSIPVLRTELRTLETLSKVLGAGEGVTAAKPKSPAAKELGRLYREVLGKHG